MVNDARHNDPEEGRSFTVAFRVTQAEHAAITALAAKKGVSVASLVRCAVAGQGYLKGLEWGVVIPD